MFYLLAIFCQVFVIIDTSTLVYNCTHLISTLFFFLTGYTSENQTVLLILKQFACLTHRAKQYINKEKPN